ncbi:MAG: heavy-metal-associated domain-containing protein [Candidatus Thiodiazotropha sp. (ex Rostrolucina anterorostrata)]|nr:heavy-metal-associated domain-containing protein [Candidatus Thiodiazotropha sp. (ex Rostrolucina anterorostrata)]
MRTYSSMKIFGAWEVRRKIKVPALNHDADAMAVERALDSLPGIRRVAADATRQQVIVLYDIRGADFQTIVAMLEHVGFPPLDDWWSRRKMSWYTFTDSNGRDNAKAPPAACCNKPPNELSNRPKIIGKNE